MSERCVFVVVVVLRWGEHERRLGYAERRTEKRRWRSTKYDGMKRTDGSDDG